MTPDLVRADFVANFDSLPTAGLPGGLSGTPVTNYLATFGITLSGVTPGTTFSVYDARLVYTPQVIAPSPFNVVSQPGSPDPVSYTLNFALPQGHFSMTRIGLNPLPSGLALPQWQASAFDASGNLLGTVGENAFSVFSNLPPATFTLNGPNISSVRIASNNNHFAAFGAVVLDDFTLTAIPSVPEPHSLLLTSFGSLMLLGHQARRRWCRPRPMPPEAS